MNSNSQIPQLKIDLKSDLKSYLKSHLAGTKSDLAKYDFKSKITRITYLKNYLFKKKNLKAAFLSLFFEKNLL
jgi:hypothetical protein